MPVILGTNGFEVESVSSLAIQVKHPSCDVVTILCPYRIFKDVHNASVSVLDNEIHVYETILHSNHNTAGNIVGCCQWSVCIWIRQCFEVLE